MNALWTAREDDALRANYPRHMAAWDGWAELLPGRSAYAIQQRASRLGLSTKRRRWTPEEVELVSEHYPRHGAAWDGWDELLPGRSRQAISRIAYEHGARFRQAYPPWGLDEDMVLLSSIADAARRLGRTAADCARRAGELYRMSRQKGRR